jgi:hypothetical protein
MPSPIADTDLEDDQITDDAPGVDGAEDDDADGDGDEAGADAEEGDGAVAGSSGDGDEGSEDDSEGDQLVISLEGEEDAADDVDDGQPTLVRKLRAEIRDRNRQLRDLERRVQSSAPPAIVSAGPEPTLEGCDHDEARFKSEYATWMRRKVEADATAENARKTQEQQQAQWTRRLATVDAEVSRMRLPEADDAREAFETQLSPLQQAIILSGPDDAKMSGQLRYAIGRNPTVAQRIAKIEDPVKFTLAIAELMHKMKVTKKGAPPPPEKRVRTGTPGRGAGGGVDNQLARLQAEAAKTGNYTKVTAYHAARKKT